MLESHSVCYNNMSYITNNQLYLQITQLINTDIQTIHLKKLKNSSEQINIHL